MSKSRFPVTFLKGLVGLSLAVLLIAPVAVLWSGPEDRLGDGGRQPLQFSTNSGVDMPAWWMEQEVAWLQKTKRKAYGRGDDFWPAEMGKRKLGRVDLTENHSDEKPVSVSGTKVREQLKGGERPDPRIMRPEIADILIEAYRE